MADAVRAFLRAAGLDPARNPELAQTPALVAGAWADEFLDGYRLDPRAILAERMPVAQSGQELVVLSRLSFTSVCPHHLLPYGGRAHIAYVPSRQVVGFGQVVRLLDCFAHRLILQEDLARSIAGVLVRILKARGAGVVLEAEQVCLALRGGRRRGSRVTCEAWAGSLRLDGELRQRFLGAARGD